MQTTTPRPDPFIDAQNTLTSYVSPIPEFRLRDERADIFHVALSAGTQRMAGILSEPDFHAISRLCVYGIGPRAYEAHTARVNDQLADRLAE